MNRTRIRPAWELPGGYLKKEVLNCEKRKDNGRQYSRGVYFIRIHRSSCHLPNYPFVTDGGICR